MRPPGVRFTLRRMITWVILAGLMLALARFSLIRWGAQGVTHLAYWTFLLLALVPKRQGRRSMFWTGFGGFGMLYLCFTNFGYLSLPFRLPTGLILDGIYDRLPSNLSVSAIDFHQAGHAIFAALIGTLAGLVLATQVPATIARTEPLPFRAQFRGNFPTVFRWWDSLRPRRD